MHISSFVCLDDLVRADTWPSSEFIFDLVRLPIYHATGVALPKTPHRSGNGGAIDGLAGDFSLAQFRSLCQPQSQSVSLTWHALQHRIPSVAAAYLLSHLPESALVLGHAMPPWLINLLDGAGRQWIDLRVSPLRFGSDLIVGLRTNVAEIHAAVHPQSLSVDALVADASRLAARLRLVLRRQGQLRLPGNPVVFAGGVDNDPALVAPDGRLIRASDHADTLYKLARTGPMLYLPDPDAGDFARIERDSIERVIGQRVALCELDRYSLLACDDELMLIGLASPALQEGVWFGRKSYALVDPPAEPCFAAELPASGWLQVAPHKLIDERFWATAFGTQVRANALPVAAQPDLLRGLLNDWSGIAEATAPGHQWLRRGVAEAGLQRQGEALRRAEVELVTLRGEVRQLHEQIEALEARLLDSTRQVA